MWQAEADEIFLAVLIVALVGGAALVLILG